MIQRRAVLTPTRRLRVGCSLSCVLLGQQVIPVTITPIMLQLFGRIAAPVSELVCLRSHYTTGSLRRLSALAPQPMEAPA